MISSILEGVATPGNSPFVWSELILVHGSRFALAVSGQGFLPVELLRYGSRGLLVELL